MDELTGLANRRALDGILPEEVARALRHGRSLALMMADVDHFKKINDTYGHPAGDEVLRQMARLLTQRLRSIDKAKRQGRNRVTLAPTMPRATTRGTFA